MPDIQISAVISASFNMFLAVMLILVGLYSLTFNVADAKRKNHRRTEKAARAGGWCYIIGGAAVMLLRLFF